MRDFIQKKKLVKTTRQIKWDRVMNDWELEQICGSFPGNYKVKQWRRSYKLEEDASPLFHLLGYYSFRDLRGWGSKIETDRTFFAATEITLLRDKKIKN
jgi:hypothetical protein